MKFSSPRSRSFLPQLRAPSSRLREEYSSVARNCVFTFVALTCLVVANVRAQAPAGVVVPQPQPLPILPAPTAPPIVQLLPGEANSAAAIHTAKAIEVWHRDSHAPQLPPRHGRRFDLASTVGKESTTLRLRFDPRAAGATVVVKPGPGVTVEGPTVEFPIEKGGQCVLSLRLDGGFNRTQIKIYCLGVETTLPLSRATAAEVAAAEAKGAGRQ